MSGDPSPGGARRLGVLISGRGSNLQSILDAIRERRLAATLALVVSNVAGARGLDRARAAGVPALTIRHGDYPTRALFEAALVSILRDHQVDLVCLAGFMRRLGPTMVDAFRHRMLNIHPSLLPAFPGLHAQRQALLHGVKVTGATVHFVEAELDAGPIVRQAAVAVRDEDTEETLAARILAEEHRIYPEAIEAVLGGGWRVEGRRLVATPLEAGRRAEGRVNPG